MNIYHFVLCRNYGADTTAIGSTVWDLRISAAAATTNPEYRARLLIGERAKEVELLRPADLLWELDVDGGERAQREGSSRKEEDGQMIEGGRGWESERVLRRRDDGGRGDHDRA